ncbi:MAG TPA: hypothetical protein VIB02_04280 [Candidatus Limnocylindrales bacterium]|jgi:hypothetical protein
MEGLTAAALASSTIVVGYTAWWLIRHERAVRRFRAQVERPAPRDRR